MNEITKLEDKYLVLKWDDINKYLWHDEHHELLKIISKIKTDRKADGKCEQKYIVMNLNDEISLAHINAKLTELIHSRMLSKAYDEPCLLEAPKVKDIAVALVNAILKAKSPDG